MLRCATGVWNFVTTLRSVDAKAVGSILVFYVLSFCFAKTAATALQPLLCYRTTDMETFLTLLLVWQLAMS